MPPNQGWCRLLISAQAASTRAAPYWALPLGRYKCPQRWMRGRFSTPILGFCYSVLQGHFMCWMLGDLRILKLFLYHGVVDLQFLVLVGDNIMGHRHILVGVGFLDWGFAATYETWMHRNGHTKLLPSLALRRQLVQVTFLSLCPSLQCFLYQLSLRMYFASFFSYKE